MGTTTKNGFAKSLVSLLVDGELNRRRALSSSVAFGRRVIGRDVDTELLRSVQRLIASSSAI